MLVSKEFYGHYVRLPVNEVPPEIRNNPKFFPYFSGCRGAVDGPGWIPSTCFRFKG